MPKISDLSSYGQDTSITGDEYLIGTDVGGATKTFTLTSIADYVESTLTIATGGLGETNQSIPAGATRTVDIGLAGSLTFQYNSSARITLNSSATVFASGTQVQWSDAPAGGLDLTNRDYVDGEINTLASSKQNTLVSGTNIKTINSTSILGSGNIDTPNTNLANTELTVSTLSRFLNVATGASLKFKTIGTGILSFEDNTTGLIHAYLNSSGWTFDNSAPSTLVSPTSGNHIPNKTYVDSNFQPTLVSGTNIKTINGSSILGSGNIVISGGSGDSWSDAVDSDIIPDTNNTYNLGDASFRFGTVYSSSINTTIAVSPYVLLTPLSTPTQTAEGYIYYDSDDNNVKFHDGASYVDFLSDNDIGNSVQAYSIALDNVSGVNSGDETTASVKALLQTTNALDTTEILDDAITEAKLEISNSGTDGALLTYTATGPTMTWLPDTTIKVHPNSDSNVQFITIETQAAIDAAGYDDTVLAFPSDATPAQTGTGTVFDLGFSNYQYNFGAASSSTTYTLTNIKVGGYAEGLINAASEPSVTGATKLPNTADFIISTDMILCVKDFNGTRKYWFVEY